LRVGITHTYLHPTNGCKKKWKEEKKSGEVEEEEGEKKGRAAVFPVDHWEKRSAVGTVDVYRYDVC